MQSSTEQPEFQGHVARLFAGFGIPATDERQAAFWTAFKILSLLEFSRMVDQALSENGLKEKPNVPVMWGVRAGMKSRAASVYHEGASTPVAVAPEPSFGMRLVSTMFMTYMHRRRVLEQFKGDINMLARRRKCREIADWIDGCRAESMLPTLDECMAAFANGMKHVQDAQEHAHG
jgi:hypothetical protein